MRRKKIYGYVRVSSTDQNETRQYIALQKAGVSENYIFTHFEKGKTYIRDKSETGGN